MYDSNLLIGAETLTTPHSLMVHPAISERSYSSVDINPAQSEGDKETDCAFQANRQSSSLMTVVSSSYCT